MKKFILVVAGIALAAAVAALVIQNQAQTRLHQDNESLRQQLDQLAQVQADNEQFSNRLAQAKTIEEGQLQELLKLRNEVGMLRRQTAEIADLKRKNQLLNDALAGSRNAPPAQPPPEPAANAAPAAPPLMTVNLGTIQLINQTPKRINLGGGGRSCTLTPTIDADGNYDIKVVFETKKPDGRTETSMGEVTTSPGRAVVVNAGDNSIAFTPTANPGP